MAPRQGAEPLTLNAGTGGNILFTGAVGSGTRLGAINITNANNVTETWHHGGEPHAGSGPGDDDVQRCGEHQHGDWGEPDGQCADGERGHHHHG